MSVNAVSATQPAEQTELKAATGKDVKDDDDRDDAPAGPSTNASGQPIGTIISKTA